VSAQTTTSKGLELSPLRTELTIQPGTSVEGTIRVTNTTNTQIDVALNAEVFSTINQQYDYAFSSESNVVDWIAFTPTGVTVAPGASSNVGYRVSVPLTAEPGGRYISLFASTDSLGEGQSVLSRQRVASLLYITVVGDISRSGKLLSLNSPLFIGDNSTWGMTIQNTGSTHFRSRYNVTVQNAITGGRVAIVDADSLILPGTVRALNDKLPIPKWPGIYKITYTIGLGDTPAVAETRIALYFPLIWVIASICLTGASIIGISSIRHRSPRVQSKKQSRRSPKEPKQVSKKSQSPKK
jgi:hypothetical protein